MPARWETGYWGTMDIAHDRAGYYLCWGCLVWVPGIYTSPALYLAEHPVHWPLPIAIAIAAFGLAAIYINYDSDRQRQVCSSLHAAANTSVARGVPLCMRLVFFANLRSGALHRLAPP